MSSKTQQTKKRRKIRHKALGKDQKRKRAKEGTPPFPLDPAKAGPDSAEKRSAS